MGKNDIRFGIRFLNNQTSDALRINCENFSIKTMYFKQYCVVYSEYIFHFELVLFDVVHNKGLKYNLKWYFII